MSGRPSHDAAAHRDALLDAAMDLLALHGPEGFSSRDVAKAAGVSYGLIHYHFGNRTELLRQAVHREMHRYASSVTSIDEPEWVPLLVSDPLPERTWRAMLHIGMHWDEYGDLVREFPVIRRRLTVLSGRYGDEIDDVHLRAALVISGCLQMGWHAGAPWLLDAMGGADTSGLAELRPVVDDLLIAIERAVLQTAMQMSERATD